MGPVGAGRPGVRAGACLLAAAALLVSLGQLDAALKSMHRPGHGSYGMGDLANVFSPPPEPDRPATVARTWDRFDEDLKRQGRDVASSEAIVKTFLLVDLAFIAAYAALFAGAIAAFGRRLNEVKGDSEGVAAVARERAERRAAQTRAVLEDQRTRHDEVAAENAVLQLQAKTRVPFLWLGLLAAFDLAENFFQWRLVHDSSTLLFGALSLFSLLKWLFFFLLVGYLISAAISVARHAWAKRQIQENIVQTTGGASPGGGGRPETDPLPPNSAPQRDVPSTVDRPFDTWWGALKLFRLPFILLALYTFALLRNEQFADVLRRWMEGGAGPFVACGAAVAAGVVGRTVAHRIAYHADKRWEYSISPWALLSAGVIGVAAASILKRTDRGGLGLLVPAVLALILLIAHGLLRRAQLEPPNLEDDPKGRSDSRRAVDEVLAPLLAALPPAVLGLALIQASLGEVAYSRSYEFLILITAGVGLLAMAVFLGGHRLGLGPKEDGTLPRLNGVVCYVGLVLTAIFAGLVLVSVHSVAQAVGTVTIVLAFLILVTYLALAMTWVSERVVPPRLFLAVRLGRIPVLTLLVVWAVAAAALNDGEYHDVRRHPDAEARAAAAGSSGVRPIVLREALNRWLDAQAVPDLYDAPRPRAGADKRRRIVPLVLVTAEGGGVRAAYWTALTLECLFGSGGASNTCRGGLPPESVFAASGISGGSVGLVGWAAHNLDPSGDGPGWVKEKLDDDFLAPTIAWSLYADLPNALLTLHDIEPLDRDRAAVLEEAWERAWPDDRLEEPFLALEANAERRFPLLMLGGTSVLDGCRLNVSIIDGATESAFAADEIRGAANEPPVVENCVSVAKLEAGPVETDWTLAASKDLSDFLRCGQGTNTTLPDDVRLSTAALLSARFPYVTPSGRLEPCRAGTVSTTWVVDGGYFDTSGASVIVELWARLARLIREYNAKDHPVCIEPFLLQIDNHYADPPGPDPAARPTEIQVPLRALGGVRGAHEANARQSSADAVKREDELPGVTNRYVHIYPRAHPGTRAPLGWTLSLASIDDLNLQLEDANGGAVDRVHEWFADMELPSCATA